MTSKSIAVVFLKDIHRARETAAQISSDAVDAVTVDTSDDLYRFLNMQRVDVLVLENDVGSFFSGIDMLGRIFNDLLRPITLLVADPSREITEQARRLGVTAVLPSDSDATLVTETVHALLSSHGAAQVFIHPLARRVVQEAAEITPLPQLLVKLSVYLVDEANISLANLAEDISVDAKVTADLLTLINSSAMGLQRQVTKVFDAVNFLGIRRTVSLIISSSVIKAQNRLSKPMSGSDRMWYNKRSVLVASSAYAFAKRLANVSADTAYVLGLFQELGILVMASAFGEKYQQVLHRVRTVGQLRLEQVEESDFGLTHADVSGAVLQKWGLPTTIVRPVLEHHHVKDGPDETPAVERRFIHAMRLAEAAANLADCNTPQRLQQFNRLVTHYGSTRANDAKLALQEAVAKASESSKLFSIPIPDERELQELTRQIEARIEAG